MLVCVMSKGNLWASGVYELTWFMRKCGSWVSVCYELVWFMSKCGSWASVVHEQVLSVKSLSDLDVLTIWLSHVFMICI